MKNPLMMKSWSPYVAGAGIGILCWFIFLFFDRVLGFAGAYVHIAAIMGQCVVPRATSTSLFLSKHLLNVPNINWLIGLILGTFFGSMISSYLGKSRADRVVPRIWEKRFGKAHWCRYLGAFAGGLLVSVGAWMAGGCTCSLAITGGQVLAISGWLFIVFVFSSGIITGLIVYRR